MKAAAWCAAFRIAKKWDLDDYTIKQIYDGMCKDAEHVGRVQHHRHEQVMLFPDGSRLVYDHESMLGRVTHE